MEPFIVLGLDGAPNDLRAMLCKERPIPGVWGEKIGDDILWNGAKEQLQRGFPKKFVDLKHYDTKDRLVRIVKGYASLPRPPALLTISGEIYDLQAFREIVAAAEGKVKILLTGPLSNYTEQYCFKKYGVSPTEWMLRITQFAQKSGAEGVTCPAWLLNDGKVRESFELLRKKDYFTVVSTGIRSEGVAAGNHVEPRTPEFAMKHGATLVVIESEVTSLPGRDPLRRLKEIHQKVAQSVLA